MTRELALQFLDKLPPFVGWDSPVCDAWWRCFFALCEIFRDAEIRQTEQAPS